MKTHVCSGFLFWAFFVCFLNSVLAVWSVKLISTEEFFLQKVLVITASSTDTRGSREEVTFTKQEVMGGPAAFTKGSPRSKTVTGCFHFHNILLKNKSAFIVWVKVLPWFK